MRTLEPESPPLASQVVEAPPPEARLSGRAAPVETSREFSRGDARAYRLFLLIWAAANLLFWTWWLRPEHVETGWLYALFTLPFAYEVTVLPSVFLFYLGRMRHPSRALEYPGQRVALITLCVPASESVDVIRRQLEALISVEYPHDSWILDEGRDPRVQAMAREYEVKYFSRAEIPRYNQASAPFAAKTKAGNVNAWLDVYGSDYDFFVQFDIDHRPNPDYLDRVLGYFLDPSVAWVQPPSVYANLDNWVARGAAEQETILQGPLQRGFYGANRAPFIIGSHAAYRMSAIREIGGFQPTRAEDHLDTLVLAARGYRGVFVRDILARGSGPETFETYLDQQFAWAMSLVHVLLRFTPRYLFRLPLGLALQFLFAQTWYALWSSSMLILFSIPLIVVATGLRPSGVSLQAFLLAWLPMGATAAVVWFWSRRWQVPTEVGLSWRGVILHVARWPIVFWAFVNAVLGIKYPYMITPKGARVRRAHLSLGSYLLYVAGVWTCMAIVAVRLFLSLTDHPADGLYGYMITALWGSVFFAAVITVNVWIDFRACLQAARLLPTLWRHGAALTVTAGTLAGLLVLFVAAGAQLASAPNDEAVGARVELAAPVAVEAPVADAAPAKVEAPVAEKAAAEVEAAAEKTPGLVAETPQPDDPAVVQDLPAMRVALGAYDPSLSLQDQPFDLEHWYVEQGDADVLREKLAHARGQHAVLVTIEPFPPDQTQGSVLEATVSGQSDSQLVEMADVIRAAAPQLVFVRWAHEMELDLSYPWAGQDPLLYQAAYRHVVDVFRAEGATNVRWVWSPAGNPGALAYYPGADFVDYVGLTLLGDAGWDATFGMPPQSFPQLLGYKYAVVAPVGKPIIIAELGVSGTPERKSAWLSEVPDALRYFPAVRAISYFDSVNAVNNRLPTQPDWRVTPDVFAQLWRRISLAG